MPCLVSYSVHKFFVFRTKRETEVAQLRKAGEEEKKMHESQIAELSKKHFQTLNELNEQLEQTKRVKKAAEKTRLLEFTCE